MTQRTIAFPLILAALAIALISCSKSGGIAPAPSTEIIPLALEDSAKEDGKTKWDKLAESARREGTLVVYGPGAYEVRLGLAEPFQRKYGVNVETLALRGAENSARIFSERRAGIYIPDLSFGGATTLITDLKPAGVLDTISPTLLLPEFLDPSDLKKNWWGGELRYVDKGKYILSFSLYPSPGLAINTDLVKSPDIVSYFDLLNSKWKGKILWNDPTLAGTGLRWFGMVGRKIMNWDFLRELTKQEPVIIRDQRLQAEWLARGRYPVAISPNNSYMRPFFEAGSPVQWLDVKEGSYMTSGGGNVVLMNRAPHPHAAKLFLNWLLTQEGQKLWTRTKQIQSLRLDIDTGHLDPVEVRKPDVKYVIADDEELLLLEPENSRLARDILAGLIK